MTGLVEFLGVSGVLVLSFLGALMALTSVFLVNLMLCRARTAPDERGNCTTRH